MKDKDGLVDIFIIVLDWVYLLFYMIEVISGMFVEEDIFIYGIPAIILMAEFLCRLILKKEEPNSKHQ